MFVAWEQILYDRWETEPNYEWTSGDGWYFPYKIEWKRNNKGRSDRLTVGCHRIDKRQDQSRTVYIVNQKCSKYLKSGLILIGDPQYCVSIKEIS